MKTSIGAPILAVTYSDGIAADQAIAEFGYALRDAGISVAGIVQHNRFVRDRTKCTMVVEELASGTTVQISEYRGEQARGCRLDRGALCNMTALLAASVASLPDLLLVNKFGKVEAEGGGLRDVLTTAVELGIPAIVGVPFRNIDQWHVFSEGLAEECGVNSERIIAWLKAHGISVALRELGNNAHGKEALS